MFHLTDSEIAILFHRQTLLILLVELVNENTNAIVVTSRFQNEMDFQDVLLNTHRQPTRYRSSLKDIMIVNHRDLILLISTVRPKTMWGNLHVRVYPQPSGPAYTDFRSSLSSAILWQFLLCSFMSLYTDRKRVPLPPQATTFLTSSSVAPEYARDAPPQSPAAPVAPRSLRDFSAHDSNVPLGPRSMTHVSEELLPRNAPMGGSEYDRDRGRNNLRQSNHYPAPPPISKVDDEEGRLDRYSRVIFCFSSIFIYS